MRVELCSSVVTSFNQESLPWIDKKFEMIFKSPFGGWKESHRLVSEDVKVELGDSVYPIILPHMRDCSGSG